MKALLFKDIEEIELKEKEIPKVSNSNDVLIKIHSSGICGTDLRIFSGTFNAKKGVVLGHEAVGVVEEVGNKVTKFKKNDRVIIDPTLFDSDCYYCNRGKFNLCDNKAGKEVGVDMDGSFAEYIVMPDNFVYKIPDSMSFDKAVLVEPLACVLNNIRACNLSVEDSVVILGAGPIGLVFAIVAQKVAKNITIVEKDKYRIEFAKQFCDNVIDSSDENYKDKIKSINNNRKANLVVDVTGVLLEESLQIVDKGGRIVLMGFNSKYRANISPLYITNNAIQIIGAGDYNSVFAEAIDLAENYELEKLITHKMPLEEYEKALSMLVGYNINTKEPVERHAMKIAFNFE